MRTSPVARPTTAQRRSASRGQVVVIFAGAMLLFAMLSAAVIDLSWYWTNNLRMQRAADAAAQAGAVWLPADVPKAYATARAEAVKNGYTDGTGGFTVTPVQDTVNPRRLHVTIAGPIGTYFARIVGINSFAAKRDARAEFTLPVPMGSPENYYGVFGTIRGATFTQPQTNVTTTDTGWQDANNRPNLPNPNQSTWTNANRADANNDNNVATSTTTSGSLQYWNQFGLTFNPTVTALDGIELRMRAGLSGSGNTTTDCRIDASLSWNNGTTWTALKSQTLTSTNETLYTLGTTTDLWGHLWTVNELQNVWVRLASNKVTCSANRTAYVDTLELRASYKYSTTSTVTSTPADVDMRGPGTPCVNAAAGCYQPDGAVLNDRGFWATMNTEGASNVNGDAYQPKYDTAGSTIAPVCPAGPGRSCYDPQNYYNYGVEMPAGSTNGYVYVFDPGFCETATNKGTGDRWFGNNAGVSSWYELLQDVNLTPYDYSDDSLVASSGTRFMNLNAADSSMGGTTGGGTNECRQQNTQYGDGRDFHDSWYLLNPGAPLSGGAAGRIYRLHTTGTDPRAGGNPNSQNGVDGEQSFSLYVSSTNVGAQGPRIYGLGAMQMFTPLSTASGSGTQSEFYLAQIEAIHAGKSMVIDLWDPGDAYPLTANVQILMPTATGWTPVNFSYTAKTGTSNSNVNNACNSNSSGNTNAVTTANGNQLGVFNGCWLTITVKIPTTYTAPDPAGVGAGWWKIRYNMAGNGTSNDVTTWKVTLIGNPVHLVLP